MSRRGRDDEPFLFDLPLVPEEQDPEPEPPPPEPPETQPGDRPVPEAGEELLPLLPPDPFLDDPFGPAPPMPADPGDPVGWQVVDAGTGPVAAPPVAAAAPVAPGLGGRLIAAAVDGLVLGSVGSLALVGATLLDVSPGLAMLPGLATLLLVFSFAYSVVPLAFWGATPGMAAAHLVARDRDGGPLTFGQTARRWLAGLVTTLCAGLPMLLALGWLGGRSPADRLSGSSTWQRR